jgi:hypothetical protein
MPPEPLVLRSGWCWRVSPSYFAFKPFYIVDGFGDLVQARLKVLHAWLLDGVDE